MKITTLAKVLNWLIVSAWVTANVFIIEGTSYPRFRFTELIKLYGDGDPTYLKVMKFITADLLFLGIVIFIVDNILVYLLQPVIIFCSNLLQEFIGRICTIFKDAKTSLNLD